MRRLKEFLADIGIRVSHVAIWKWIQKFGGLLRDLFKRWKRRLLVVDETEIRRREGRIFVFAALDPENREIVNFLVSEHREAIDVLGFLTRCLRCCEGKPVIVTDGGPWYRWPAEARA